MSEEDENKEKGGSTPVDIEEVSDLIDRIFRVERDAREGKIQISIKTGQHFFLGLILLSALKNMSESDIPSENWRAIVKVIAELSGEAADVIAKLPMEELHALVNVVMIETLASTSRLLEKTVGRASGLTIFPMKGKAPEAA